MNSSTIETTLTLDSKLAMDDPVSALNQYYQQKQQESHQSNPKKSTISLKKQFQYGSIRNNNGNLLWQSTFICPMTKHETKSSYNDKMKDDLHVVDGTYYYSTKKKAQKSAAWNACVELFSQENVGTGVNVSGNDNDVGSGSGSGSGGSEPLIFNNLEDGKVVEDSLVLQDKLEMLNYGIATDNKLENGQPLSVLKNHNGETIVTSKTPSIEMHREQKKNNECDEIVSQSSMMEFLSYPQWIKSLYVLGVSDENIQVSFHEDFSPDTKECSIDTNAPASGFPPQNIFDQIVNPTMLKCTIQIRHPINIEITGPSCSTKKNAAKKAASILEAKLLERNEILAVDENKYAAVIDKRSTIKKKLDRLKSALLPKSSTLYHPLIPIFKSKVQANKSLLLYEIEIKGNGFPWIRDDYESNRNHHYCHSRMGILFRSEMEPLPFNGNKEGHNNASILQSEFSIPQLSSFHIKLYHRTILSSHVVTNEKLEHIQRFNRIILTEGKNYGMNGNIQKEHMHYGSQKSTDCSTNISRGYLFVPLMEEASLSGRTKSNVDVSNQPVNLKIDWTLLLNAYNEKSTPLVSCLDFFLSSFNVPFVGIVDTKVLAFIFFLLSIFLLIPFIHFVIISCSSPHSVQCDTFAVKTALLSENLEQYIGFVCMALSFVLYINHYIQKPKWMINKETLSNRFMKQTNAANSSRLLYILSNSEDGQRKESRRSCKSQFLPKDAVITESKKEYYMRKFNLDIRKATFGDYYYKKYGYEARFPREELLPVHSLTKHAEFDPTKLSDEHQVQSQSKSSDQNESTVHILPEIVKVLPIPRDIIYTFQYAHIFMLPLEREFELLHIQQYLLHLGENLSSGSSGVLTPSKKSSRQVQKRAPHRSFLSLLREATTIRPRITYQELEFVGDTILSYFFSLNLFSINAALKYDVDDLEEVKNRACKNVCIAEKGMSCGLHRLLYLGGHKWVHSSSFSNVNVAHQEDLETIIVPDKSIADVTEALLAVPFLSCETLDQASLLIIGILEKLNLPLDGIEEFDQGKKKWFFSKSTCLNQPYPFHLDNSWSQQLKQIGMTLTRTSEILTQGSTFPFDRKKLDIGRSKLLQKFPKHAFELDKDIGKILLAVALFDDNLEAENLENSTRSEEDDVEMRFLEPPPELVNISLLRDTLFIVGNSALHLVLTAEVFSRYPNATAGDLHLLRVCGGDCDDLLVYIMIKNGIHLSLYDDCNEQLHILLQEIVAADNLGRELWKKNNGWILGTGVQDFKLRKRDAKRWLQTSKEFQVNLINDPPKYVGIGGGRFIGKRNKMKPKLTDDLAFSMKAIVGALVLSLGVERMWECMLPIFEELLLLTPEELRREFSSTSSVCASYQKG